DGANGRDGVDGKSPSVVTERGKGTNPAGEEVDGTWVITRDGDGNELSRTFVPDGKNGDKGDQGEKGDKGDTGAQGEKGDKGDTGANGQDGRDGVDGKDGRDGLDGKTPTVETEAGKDSDGRTGIWVIIRDGDGNEISRDFVRDGLDGKSPTVKTESGKNTDGHTGIWVIVIDSNGNEVSREFVRDGKDGKDGKDGVCTCINKPIPKDPNKPDSGETNKPNEGNPNKPDGEETNKPNEGNPNKPDGGETNKPNEGNPNKPDGGETNKPNEGNPNKPDGGKTNKPGEGDPHKPSLPVSEERKTSTPNMLPITTFGSSMNSTTPQRTAVSPVQLPNTGTETMPFLNLLAFASLGLAGVILSKNRKKEE
ncbi:LPXTG cell wall anchor domain-containing protein, partial [Streptococcus acidominimus]